MFEWLPIEYEGISVISAVIFTGFGVAMGYLYARLAKLETQVVTTCLDVVRLDEMSENIEKMVGSMKTDNHELMDWIRQDSKENWNRIDKRLSDIQKQLYKGDKHV